MAHVLRFPARQVSIESRGHESIAIEELLPQVHALYGSLKLISFSDAQDAARSALTIIREGREEKRSIYSSRHIKRPAESDKGLSCLEKHRLPQISVVTWNLGPVHKLWREWVPFISRNAELTQR